MQVHICGVRGSTPMSGTEFLRHGGHTSCIALAHDGQRPSLVLDAGTGLRVLARQLGDAPFRGTILLSHLHWDHTQGLPFFPPGDRPGARLDIRLPAQPDDSVVLSQLMGPPFFPVTPDQMGGTWTTSGLAAGHSQLEGFEVLALDIPHRGGRTFGFRVTSGGRAVAYLSDHSPTDLGPGQDGQGEIHPAAIELCADADVLFHDAQYTAAQFEQYSDFGHSTIEYAVALARATAVKHLVLFHHEPTRTDDELDALVAAHASVVHVTAASEGTVLDLPSLNLTERDQMPTVG